MESWSEHIFGYINSGAFQDGLDNLANQSRQTGRGCVILVMGRVKAYYQNNRFRHQVLARVVIVSHRDYEYLWDCRRALQRRLRFENSWTEYVV